MSHKQVGPQYCPKCGHKMNGPFYAEESWSNPEHLVFVCPCGFKSKVPVLDVDNRSKTGGGMPAPDAAERTP